MSARAALLAALMLAAAPAAMPAAAQTYLNGGPQPGDDGIGTLPTPGRAASDEGMTLGQSGAQQPTANPATAPSADPAADPSANPADADDAAGQGAIDQAVRKALQGAEQSGGQGQGQAQTQDQGQSPQGGTLPSVGQSAGQSGAGTGAGGTDAQQYSGQGGFVSDDTGLGHVTNSSGPALQTGPRKEIVKVTQAKGGVVRWLDKVSGRTVDITLADGQSKTEGRLTIELTQCRYPVADPSSNAYAYLVIHDSQVQKPIFHGWMIASSPALDPLDSPRYDVWLLHCTTS